VKHARCWRARRLAATLSPSPSCGVNRRPPPPLVPHRRRKQGCCPSPQSLPSRRGDPRRRRRHCRRLRCGLQRWTPWSCHRLPLHSCCHRRHHRLRHRGHRSRFGLGRPLLLIFSRSLRRSLGVRPCPPRRRGRYLQRPAHGRRRTLGWLQMWRRRVSSQRPGRCPHCVRTGATY